MFKGKLRITIFILFSLFFVFFAKISAQEMNIFVPKLKLIKNDGRYILYEESLLPEKMLLFFHQLEKRSIFSPNFYIIPGTSNYYFVSASTNGDKPDTFRNTLFLFEEIDNQLVEKFRSTGFEPFRTDEVKPIFFVGADSVLVLAEKYDSGGFLAIEAFEFRKNQINYLGILNIQYRVGSTNRFWEASPLKLFFGANQREKVQIVANQSSYQITLTGEFYEDFITQKGRKLSSKNSVLSYKLDTSGFALSSKRSKNRKQKFVQ